MGFESYRAELRGGTATFSRVDEVVGRHPAARPDPEALRVGGSHYYTIRAASSILEVEVSDDPVCVSCRFTLCHPPAVDEVFHCPFGKVVGVPHPFFRDPEESFVAGKLEERLSHIYATFSQPPMKFFSAIWSKNLRAVFSLFEIFMSRSSGFCLFGLKSVR